MSANAYCGPDDDDECDECQVCFESENLRQVCECLHNICLSCVQQLINHAQSHVSAISCPNCRRRLDIQELTDQLGLVPRVPTMPTPSWHERVERTVVAAGATQIARRWATDWFPRPLEAIRAQPPTQPTQNNTRPEMLHNNPETDPRLVFERILASDLWFMASRSD